MRRWSAGWQGGRFDATTAEWYAMLSRNAKRCSKLGVSEAVDRGPLQGWDMAGGECATTWNTKVWTKNKSTTIILDTPTWRRGTARRSGVQLEVVLLDHKDGWDLMDITTHLPAHLYKIFQQRANRAALRKMGPAIAELQRKWQPDETELAMDANRDMRLKRNRRLVREALKGTGMKLVVPPEGTHGKRKIDVRASTSDHHGKGRMFRMRPGFDHRGWKNTHASEED
jgi:hypothetical protein